MRYRYRVLVMLFLLSIITYLDRVCISVAGPRMQADLDISPERWGWVMGAFTLAYAMFEIQTGMREGWRLIGHASRHRFVTDYSSNEEITMGEPRVILLLGLDWADLGRG